MEGVSVMLTPGVMALTEKVEFMPKLQSQLN